MATPQRHEHTSPDMSDPAPSGYPLQPAHLDPDLPFRPRGLYIGTGGDLDVVLDGPGGDTTCPFRNLRTGQVYDIAPKQILSANKTADNIIVLY